MALTLRKRNKLRFVRDTTLATIFSFLFLATFYGQKKLSELSVDFLYFSFISTAVGSAVCIEEVVRKSIEGRQANLRACDLNPENFIEVDLGGKTKTVLSFVDFYSMDVQSTTQLLEDDPDSHFIFCLPSAADRK